MTKEEFKVWANGFLKDTDLAYMDINNQITDIFKLLKPGKENDAIRECLLIINNQLQKHLVPEGFTERMRLYNELYLEEENNESIQEADRGSNERDQRAG